MNIYVGLGATMEDFGLTDNHKTLRGSVASAKKANFKSGGPFFNIDRGP
jgi:hypothetical protein